MISHGERPERLKAKPKERGTEKERREAAVQLFLCVVGKTGSGRDYGSFDVRRGGVEILNGYIRPGIFLEIAITSASELTRAASTMGQILSRLVPPMTTIGEPRLEVITSTTHNIHHHLSD